MNEIEEGEVSDKQSDRDRHSRRDRHKRRKRDRGRRSDDEYHDSHDENGDYDDDYDEHYDDRSRYRDDDYRDRRRDRDHSDGDRSRHSRYEGSDREQPYHTIIIKYLPNDITETEIRHTVTKYNLTPRDVRIVRYRRERGSGSSRGFAFVEFDTVAEATHWMEVTQGVVDFSGGYNGILFYSIPKDSSSSRNSGFMIMKSDWNCANCGAHNFKRRDVCFKCSAEKKNNILYGEGYEEMSSIPTFTLLFRNLDTLSTEDSVLAVVSNFATLPIKKIKIAKDSLTGISRGFCYVEMHSVNEAMQLHNLLGVPGNPLTIDGREVSISYACTSATYMRREESTNIANAALAAAQWSNRASEKSSSSSQSQYSYNQQYYQQYGGNYSSDSVNTAAAVAQNALQQIQVAREIQKKQLELSETIIAKMQQKDALTPEMALAQQAQQWTKQQSGEEQGEEAQASSSVGTQCAVSGEGDVQYPVPDMSTYVYDESCGYYYDSFTGLYYDAHSQYYYNADKQIYLYWDGIRQTYILAPTDSSSQNSNPLSADNSQDKKMPKGKERQDKVKIAKKIAKDMERWAKTLNQKKDGPKPGTGAVGSPVSYNVGSFDGGQSASTDVCFAMLEKRTTPAERQAAVIEAMKKKEETNESGLVAEYGGGSDSDEDDSKPFFEKLKNEENKLLDWNKMACLLCKRQFPNKQTLQKHQQMSDLHKQNLEILKKQKFSDKEIAEIDAKERDSKYRDRAKERRMKYGEPEPPKNSRLKEQYYKDVRNKGKSSGGTNYEEPTKKGIGSENIGNKMLKAMGWNEGQGLGRANQGMTDIIEAQKRNATAGLGMQGSSAGATAGDSYRDTVKKLMQARYKEIDS